jgi:hypothetical protein
VRYFYAMTFRDELDMLRCQLAEHAERVHKFVIMEATTDHSGAPKPLVLQENWAEFAPWHDKIEYVTTADQYPGFWQREQTQRNIGMGYLLGTCADEDIVIVSDIDEFIPVSAFDLNPAPCIGLVQKLRFAAVDWAGSPGVTAVMARASVLKNAQYTCDTLRQARESFPPVTPGGYHFSWFGGPERYRRKTVCSPHQEHLERNLELSRGYAWERGLGGVPEDGNPTITGNVAEITDDYPVQVQNRECPWYWWRPGPDGLPVDELAREREVAHRASTPAVEGGCLEGRKVYVAGSSAWHPEDGSPCPTAWV